MIFFFRSRPLSKYLLRSVPQVQRLPMRALHLHAAQVENTVSGHVLTKAGCPNPKCEPGEMHAAQRRARTHPRLAGSIYRTFWGVCKLTRRSTRRFSLSPSTPLFQMRLRWLECLPKEPPPPPPPPLCATASGYVRLTKIKKKKRGRDAHATATPP